MSLYEVLHGENNIATDLLTMINMRRADFVRYRDAHLSPDGTEIRIIARIGQGAWVDNPDQIMATVKKSPYYLRDADDKFDHTFKYIWFQVPEYWSEAAKQRATGQPLLGIKDMLDATLHEIDAMTPEQRADDPRVKKMAEAIKQINDSKGGVVEI